MADRKLASGLFVTGTDTDVGKTYAACIIAKALASCGRGVGAYKPVASGFETNVGSDGEKLWFATNRWQTLDVVCPQRFKAPFAPPVAAALESKQVDETQIQSGFLYAAEHCELLLVEGAGGLMSPVSSRWTNADLVREWGLPVVIVAAWKLGVVNQVLTTLLAAEQLGIRVQAIVLNSCQPTARDESHWHLLVQFLQKTQHWGAIPLLSISYGQDEFDQPFDWQQAF